MLHNKNHRTLKNSIQKKKRQKALPLAYSDKAYQSHAFGMLYQSTPKASTIKPLSYEKKKNKISLFVNLLMKNGKKTTALRLLEKALYIFMQSLIKIKMQPLTNPYIKKGEGQKGFATNLEKGSCTANAFKLDLYKEKIRKNRLNIFFIKGLYENKGINLLPLGFTNPYILVDKDNKTSGLPLHIKKKGDANSCSTPCCDKKGFSNFLFKKQYRLGLQNIPIYPIHRPLCKRYIQYFLEKQCIVLCKAFPFIGDFYYLFEKFYQFKVFHFNRLNNFKQGCIYVHMPMALKKKGGVINQYPWYKGKYTGFANTTSKATTPFIENKQASIGVLTQEGNWEHKNSLAYKPSGLKKKGGCGKEGYPLPFRKKNLWYQNIDKISISWEKLSPAQKNSLLFSLYQAVSNVKPPLECRSKRFGGSNRQIPATVSEHRQLAYAIGWIIQAAHTDGFIQAKKKVYTFLQEPIDIATSFTTPKVEQVKWGTRNKPPMQLTKEDFQYKNTLSALPKRATPLKELSPVSTLLKAPFLKKSITGLEKKRVGCPPTPNEKRPFCIKGGGFSRKSCKISPYFCFFLANALKDAYHKRGSAVEKRNLWVDTALANRAYLRFRWW